MPCGAILYFDGETDAAIRRLWQIIEDAGLPSSMPSLNYPPHLTLVACEDMDLDRLRAQLPAFVASHPPMLVQFSGLGIFNGRIPVIYLTVTVTQALLDLHARFETLAQVHLQGEGLYYRTGAWIPHVTLDQEFPLELTGAITNALLRHPLPKAGLLRELVLVDFATGQPGLMQPRPNQPGLIELFKSRLGQYL